MKIKHATIKIKQRHIDEINRILALEPSDSCVDDAGYTEDDDSIFYYQIGFDDGCSVDIRVCSGNQNFYLNAILYDEYDEEWAVIDDRGNIDGDLIFDCDYDKNGNPRKRYIIHVKPKFEVYEVNTLKPNGEIATSQTFKNKYNAIKFYNTLQEEKEILINYDDGSEFDDITLEIEILITQSSDKQKFHIFSNIDVDNRAYSYDEVKAAIVISHQQNAGILLDYEDVMKIANAIYSHWIDGRDNSEDDKYAEYPWLEFQSSEEDGYIQKYAERTAVKFIELYLTTIKNIKVGE